MKFIRDLISRKSEDVPDVTPPTPDTIEALSDSPSMDMVGLEALMREAPSQTAGLKIMNAEDLAAKAVEEQQAQTDAQAKADAQVAEQEAKAAADILEKINARVTDDTPSPTAPVNIWDMEAEQTEADIAPVATPVSRRRRNQTRVLGFDNTQGDVVSMFDKAEKVAPTARAKFPVGWMLVADGPGRGECFSLEAGMSQIGRGEDQAIQLDFGDSSISRVNHAAIVYDIETHAFMLGHGGKKNIVRLNGNPVISNEALKTGDEIRLGETTLRFVALCTEEFNWKDQPSDEENEDVAIA